jgi:allantoin racemase
MRIDVITLLKYADEAALKARKEALQKYASKGTELRIVVPKGLPEELDTITEIEIGAPGILESVVRCEQEGADAIILWGGFDPSMLSSRSLVDIPVLGPGSTCMHIASLMADMFGVLVHVPEAEPVLWRQIRDYQLEKKCSGIYSIGINAFKIGDAEHYEAVKDAALSTVDAGADAVVFGCTSLNWHADKLIKDLKQERPGAILLHPGRVTIRTAEMLVELGVTHSKLSYPAPPAYKKAVGYRSLVEKT